MLGLFNVCRGDCPNKKIDVLILGCTHYPLLKNVIREVIGPEIEIIDSAKPTAVVLKKLLSKRGLQNKSSAKAFYRFYVTDNPEKLRKTVDIFFNGKFPGKLNRISL
ncbi:MAG: hypothetical protein HYV38_00665 [Candidatus Levybacteria bacterium]|nr:hypothetical protein [Candidatus Levybacteria bacterium]